MNNNLLQGFMETNKQPKKIGRPRVHAHVMSTAERQQRWRDRVRAEAIALLTQVKDSL
jgi:hypothetical protein